MKKLLVLLFSLLISFNSYGLFGLFEKTVCVDTDAQERDRVIYLPNETKPFTGKNQCKYENGQIESEGNVKDGKEDGKWTRWYENGQIMIVSNIIDGRVDGKVTWWYENGQKTGEQYYKDGKHDGNHFLWYENGQINAKANWKDGKCISGDCPN